MRFGCPYWSNKIRIEMLQRWILVHSFLYYNLNYNVVDDSMYDGNSRQLAEMMIKCKKSRKKSKYAYAMEGFDGSTGFGFYEKLNEEHKNLVERDAFNLRKRYHR